MQITYQALAVLGLTLSALDDWDESAQGRWGEEVNIYRRGFLSKSWLMLRFCDIGLYWALAFIAVD